MIIGFFSDHNFLDGRAGTVYTSGTLNSEFWGRYLHNGAFQVIAVGRNGGLAKGDSKEASADNVSFRYCDSLSSLSGLLGFREDKVVRDTVREVDKVVVRLPSEIGYRAITYAKQFGKAIACEVVACPKDVLQYHGSIQAKLYALLAAYRMKKYVAKCDAALYVTQRELQRRYPNPFFTTSASNVEIEEVKSNCLPARIARFNQRVPNGGLKICLVGTLENKSKGIDVAIRALSGKAHKLIVIGRGDSQEYERLAKKLSVNVEFKGFISDRNVLLSELDDADLYIQPSFQEGLSRATLEAMSRGCPAITSSAGGFAEVTHPDYIHKPGDHRALATHIDMAIDEAVVEKLVLHSLKTSENYVRATVEKERSLFYRRFFTDTISGKE